MKLETQILMKLKNSNCDKKKNSKIQIELGQNSINKKKNKFKAVFS